MKQNVLGAVVRIVEVLAIAFMLWRLCKLLEKAIDKMSPEHIGAMIVGIANAVMTHFTGSLKRLLA